MFIVDNMFTNVIMNFPLINIKSNNGWDEIFFGKFSCCGKNYI
jgi:hypothetical protein